MARGIMRIDDDNLMYTLFVHEKLMNHKVAKALQKAGGEIIRVAVTKTPLLTGELRKRSFNEGPLKKGDTYFQVVGYENFKDGYAKYREGMIGKAISGIANRGKETSYALAVHEDKAITHKVGESEFLTKAVDETSSKLEKYLQKELKI